MKHNRSFSPSLLVACLIITFLVATGLAGCSSAKTLTGSDREAVLAYGEPIADNLFRGMNAADFKTFSRDFDAQVVVALPEKAFNDTILGTVGGKLGKYISRQVESVTDLGNTVVIIYLAKFEKDDQVTVNLALGTATPHLVAGLHFNSPSLSQP